VRGQQRLYKILHSPEKDTGSYLLEVKKDKGGQDTLPQTLVRWCKAIDKCPEVLNDVVTWKKVIRHVTKYNGSLESATDDEATCIICCTRKRNVAFTACGHFICCKRCATTLVTAKRVTPRCPICRTEIDEDDLLDTFSS